MIALHKFKLIARSYCTLKETVVSVVEQPLKKTAVTAVEQPFKKTAVTAVEQPLKKTAVTAVEEPLKNTAVTAVEEPLKKPVVTAVEQPFKKFNIKHLEYNDQTFRKIMLSVKSKKSQSILLEGTRLIQEALNAGIKLEKIFYSRRKDLDKLYNTEEPVGVQFYKTPYKDMQLWSSLTTCPGIVAICKKPGVIKKSDNCIPVTVVCDQVREPGNLGAIIRCAAGAGIEKILLTKGCVDLWDSKVLRGSSGAHFHVPVESDITWEEFSNYVGPNINFLLAVNQPSAFQNLPYHPYYSIDYKKCKETVIVVGGETEGLSQSVVQKANELKGKAINIPLANNIESLNCVAALSIILFEIKRQFNS